MMIVLLLTSISDWNRSKAPNAETSLSLDGRESFEIRSSGSVLWLRAAWRGANQ
jgi:hypothetical protein